MTLLSEASFLVTPNGYKEDKLYAAIPTNGNGDMTFTRATTATRVNEAGLVELVPYNLLLRSQEFDNASFQKNSSSISANTTTAPDGTLTADTWTGDGTFSTHFLAQIVSATSGVAYTQSVFAKKGTNDFIQIVGTTAIYDANSWANFDLENGVVGTVGSSATATITDFGNGWYRCTMTATAITTASGNGLLLWLITSATASRVQTNSLATSVHLWGAQLVEGSSALTYQKTVDRLDIPRIDYTGGGCPSILLEPQRTNLVTYSNDTTNASWNKFFNSNVLISPSVISPDGSLNTNVLSFDGTTNGQLSKNVSGLTIGVSYTLSFYSKTRTGSSDLAYKILGMTNFPLLSNTSWVRNTLTFTATATSHIFLIFSNQVGSIELFGFQLEAGAYPTSYFPTTTATVTRNADAISKTGISDLIGQTEGVLFLESAALFNDLTERQIALSDGTTSNRIVILYNASSNIIQMYLIVSNIFIFSISYAISDETQFAKIAVRYSNTLGYSLWVNGVNRNSNATTSIPSSLIRLGFDNGAGGAVFFAKVKQLQLYKTYLTDAEMASLTTL
jgi:hypothetical protein